MPVVARPRRKPAGLSAVSADEVKPAFVERASDCWPDWATPLNARELSRSAARNRPSEVFAEVGRTIAVIAGLVVLAQLLLFAFHLE
jgi:hypothetical protein